MAITEIFCGILIACLPSFPLFYRGIRGGTETSWSASSAATLYDANQKQRYIGPFPRYSFWQDSTAKNTDTFDSRDMENGESSSDDRNVLVGDQVLRHDFVMHKVETDSPSRPTTLNEAHALE